MLPALTLNICDSPIDTASEFTNAVSSSEIAIGTPPPQRVPGDKSCRPKNHDTSIRKESTEHSVSLEL